MGLAAVAGSMRLLADGDPHCPPDYLADAADCGRVVQAVIAGDAPDQLAEVLYGWTSVHPGRPLRGAGHAVAWIPNVAISSPVDPVGHDFHDSSGAEREALGHGSLTYPPPIPPATCPIVEIGTSPAET